MDILWQSLNCAPMVILWLFMFRYTRNLISTIDKFNLILLCWSEGNASSIHDHIDSECIMKAIKGNNLGFLDGTLRYFATLHLIVHCKKWKFRWPYFLEKKR